MHLKNSWILFAYLLAFPLLCHAVLYDRGNGLIYDDELDITWLQDANYAKTSGYDADGLMTWSEALAWADQLVYLGYTNWRIPSMREILNPGNPCTSNVGVCDRGYNNTNGELGYMYYVNLNNLAPYDLNGNSQTGGFSNATFANNGDAGDIRTINNLRWDEGAYWYQEPYLALPGFAWALGTAGGQFNRNVLPYTAYAWAVTDGDVAGENIPVPVLAIIVLGTVLGGIYLRVKSIRMEVS